MWCTCRVTRVLPPLPTNLSRTKGGTYGGPKISLVRAILEGFAIGMLRNRRVPQLKGSALGRFRNLRLRNWKVRNKNVTQLVAADLSLPKAPIGNRSLDQWYVNRTCVAWDVLSPPAKGQPQSALQKTPRETKSRGDQKGTLDFPVAALRF